MKSSRSNIKSNAKPVHHVSKKELPWFEKQYAQITNWHYTNILIILLVLLLSLLSILPLFSQGFFPIHDDTQVARVSEMSNALKDGMLPVRWSENLGYGYGYPIFNFY